jgi:acetyl-CoA synthetase
LVFLYIKHRPGMLRTIYGDPTAMCSNIGLKSPVYFTGDGARRDKDGYYWIMGRVDDVINVFWSPFEYNGGGIGSGSS